MAVRLHACIWSSLPFSSHVYYFFGLSIPFLYASSLVLNLLHPPYGIGRQDSTFLQHTTSVKPVSIGLHKITFTGFDHVVSMVRHSKASLRYIDFLQGRGSGPES